MEGIKKLYSGNFNIMTQKHQPDGSVIITLSKRGEGKTYRFRVKDLYGENEEVLEQEVIETKPKKYLLDRLNNAKKEKKKK